ncbi:MAG: sulfurtransferase complex subunit TusB [Nitrospirae bacterium]|nr:MAG: sulfurtransferase complex subunit TusB [Nitrospirota bacterium]
MKLAVFVNEYNEPSIIDRLKAEKFGIVLVQNGVYHAALKKDGATSSLLGKDAEYYALSEDLQSRGISEDSVDPKVKVVNYEGLVDLIFNDYEKFMWL